MEKFGEIANVAKNYSKKIMGSNCYLVVVYLLSIVFIIIITYSIYLRKELSKGTKNLIAMGKLQDEEKTSISALEDSDYDDNSYENTTLKDYYVYGSANSCCAGEVINGHVSLEALSIVINLGVRLLDFEIYFKNGKVVVAAGRNNIYMKDTYNDLPIGSVFSEIKKKALNSGPNSYDPLILNFRIVSKNPNVFTILEKKIMKHFSDYLVDKKLAKQNDKYEGDVFSTPFKNLKNKVIILVDDPYKNYSDYAGFREIVNGATINCEQKKITTKGNTAWCTSKTSFYTDYQIQNALAPDVGIALSKVEFVITKPDVMGKNSKYKMHHGYGIQGVLMNFGGGFHDDNLKGYRKMFLESGKAFILKPPHLRPEPTTVFEIEQQNPELNPGTKEHVITVGKMKMKGFIV